MSCSICDVATRITLPVWNVLDDCFSSIKIVSLWLRFYIAVQRYAILCRQSNGIEKWLHVAGNYQFISC